MTAAGWPGARPARRAAQWGRKKYAGSLAEDVCRRLDAMDVINRGMVFAATLLLCLFRSSSWQARWPAGRRPSR